MKFGYSNLCVVFAGVVINDGDHVVVPMIFDFDVVVAAPIVIAIALIGKDLRRLLSEFVQHVRHALVFGVVWNRRGLRLVSILLTFSLYLVWTIMNTIV